MSNRLPATRVRLDAVLAARAPTLPGPATRGALAAVEDLEENAGEGAVWCQGPARGACLSKALTEAALAQHLAPLKCDGYALEARARVVSGQVVAGLDELERAAGMASDRVECLQQLESIAHTARDEKRAQAALDRIANLGCSDNAECARNLIWVAQHEEARGSPNKALALYKRANLRTPEDDAVLESIARLALAGGLHAEAAEDFEKLARRHPEDSRWKLAAQGERTAALRAVEGL